MKTTDSAKLLLTVVLLAAVASRAQQAADPATYANYGAQLASQGKCAEALPYLEYAVAQNPSLPGVWTRIGYCKESAGDKAAAVEAYRKAVAADPNDAYAKGRVEALAPGAAVAPVPAAAAAESAADSGEGEAEEPKPKSRSKKFKKFHVFLGGGSAMLLSPAGASDIFGTGYVADLRFIYHMNSKFGFLLDFSAEGHVSVGTTETLPGGYVETTSAGALALVQTGLGSRYAIGGLAGKTVVPYLQGELVFSSGALAAVSTTSVSGTGTTVVTDAGVGASISGVGVGLAGGVALGKGFGAFLEMGYRISGILSISALRIQGGLKF